MATRTSVSPKWITHREVAGLVSIDTETLRDWVATGEWPEPISVVRQTWFYRADVVERFLETGVWPEGTKFKAGVGKGRVAGQGG
jgi:hypothetical protein